MTLDYHVFIQDLFEIIDYLLDKIEGIDNAIIYSFGMVIRNTENYFHLFQKESLLSILVKFLKYSNAYLNQCISYFTGDSSNKTILIKFISFDFSTILEIIFRYSYIVGKFLKEEVFVDEIEKIFYSFYTFGMNHKEFSSFNEDLLLPVLESFNCVMVLIKHKKVYQHFLRKYDGRYFF